MSMESRNRRSAPADEQNPPDGAIPFADDDDQPSQRRREPDRAGEVNSRRRETRPSRLLKWLGPALIVILSAAHGAAIWFAMGGLAGMSNGWPLWKNDHSLYYHSAIVTRAFLKNSWTTAGYDPYFMSGYAKSVVYPSSSTLPELAVALFGGDRPELAYKIYVLLSAAAVPWLIALACIFWRVPPGGTAIAILLFLIYIWTDFPIRYVQFGMVPYFLGIPLSLAAIGAFARFLDRGGAMTWLLAAVLLSLAFLVHFTIAMVAGPAAAAAYIAAIVRSRQAATDRARKLTAFTHAAVWLIPLVVLVVNSFWWLPGIWLTETKGPSDFVFKHLEGARQRLRQIVSTEAPVECVLIAAGLPGIYLFVRRAPVHGWAAIGFCAAGFAWGYLAAETRSLDFLQPGRHTYAFFSVLAVAAGAALHEMLTRLRAAPRGGVRLDRWAIAGAVLIGVRLIGYPGYPQFQVLSSLFAPEPFLSSRPTPRAFWVVDRVGRHLKPGQRLFYEEGGFSIGVPDPFQDGRLSGLLPERTGVQLIGGPYLHASLKTNFTQFGEGKLCEKMNWTKQDFLRYAKLYGPSAILCWSPHARRFCKENSDVVQVLDDDGIVLLGRVKGFEGDFLEGTGTVEAKAGVLRLHDLSPGLDGSVVLRYHSVPYLRARPAIAIEEEKREDDPVPFIRLRPPPGTSDVELRFHLPVGR
jgi:hypothetical protein